MTVKTYRDWLYTQYDENTRQIILNEIPHGNHLVGHTPAELNFLVGHIDFGFENTMSPDLVKQFIDAFSNKGVAIPKTEWKMRYRGGMGVLIEPSDGSEPILPIYWKQGVYVVNSQDVFTWIGKRVRQDQLGVKIDFNLYNDTEDGWEIKNRK